MMPADFSRNMRQWPGVLLLILSIIIGLSTYQNYGVSWDELTQREMGMVSYRYIFKGDNFLHEYVERDHGVGFELPLVLAEKVLRLDNNRDVLLMRHLVSHVFFLLCMYCGYVLALRLFKNQWLALLCFLLLVYHPRIYAHSFFNSKDVPFLGVIVVAMLMAEAAFRTQKWWVHLLLGIALGYATSIRILGITPAAIIFLFYGLDLLTNIRNWKVTILTGSLCAFGFCAMLYVAWPTLWVNPVHNFIEAYQSMAKFRWESTILLHGTTILSTELPWYYIPLWFCISVPEVWLLAGLGGIVIALVMLARNTKLLLTNTPERNYLLYGLLIAIPITMIIALHSIVYDDWRHVYFIYPAFVFFTVMCVQYISKKKTSVAIVVAILCTVQLVDIGWFMLRNQPNTQTYFNRLVWHGDQYLRYRYDLDYWGSAYKQGFEEILRRDPSYDIRVAGYDVLLHNNYDILPATDRARIKIVKSGEQENYFMTNFRNHKEDFPDYDSVFYDIKVQGSTIMRVYKAK